MNPENLGNAWFVENLETTNSPDQTYQKLATIDFAKTAVSESKFVKDLPKAYALDSQASIILTNNEPGNLKYKSSSSKDAFIVVINASTVACTAIFSTPVLSEISVTISALVIALVLC